MNKSPFVDVSKDFSEQLLAAGLAPQARYHGHALIGLQCRHLDGENSTVGVGRAGKQHQVLRGCFNH